MCSTDGQLVTVILATLFACTLSFWGDLWPLAYALYLHLTDFLLFVVQALSGVRCVYMHHCISCSAFIASHQMFYLPRLVVLLFQHAMGTLTLYAVTYIVSGWMVVNLAVFHRTTRAIVGNVVQSPTPPQLPPLPSQILVEDTTEVVGDDACPICMDGWSSGKVYALPCAHAFHEECIMQWLAREMRCPMCNLDLLEMAVDA